MLADPRLVRSPETQTAELYERYGVQLRRYCAGQLRSREDAEDAVQNTFLRVYTALGKGVVPEFEAAWLYKIAHNVCLSRRLGDTRRARVEAPHDLQLLEERIAAPQPEREALVGLEDALASLPESLRRAILLREWQGLSYAEIAVALGLSHSAVETLIFRARRRLAEALKQPVRKFAPALDVGTLLRGLLLRGGATKLVAGAAVVAGVAGAGYGVGHLREPAPPAPAASSTALAGGETGGGGAAATAAAGSATGYPEAVATGGRSAPPAQLVSLAPVPAPPLVPPAAPRATPSAPGVPLTVTSALPAPAPSPPAAAPAGTVPGTLPEPTLAPEDPAASTPAGPVPPPTPAATVPAQTVPPASAPSAPAPQATVPAATVPAATAPSTTAAATVAAATVPASSVPVAAAPAVATPAAAAPTVTTPAVTTPALTAAFTTPEVTTAAIVTPAVSTTAVTTTAVTTPAATSPPVPKPP